MRARIGWIPLALLLFGCSDGGDDGGFEPSPDAAPPLPTSDELYSLERVWDLRIDLPEPSWDALFREPRVYVPGRLSFEGRSWEDVGVRLKGAFSFANLNGKASFKIKFNRYDRELRFLGMESLTLNNMGQDRAFVHEWTSYSVFRAAGLPAPRSGYVRLVVNDQLFGLYANVESVDDTFLERWFDDPKGNLYEGQLRDLLPDHLWELEQDEGSDLSRDDLAHLIDVANRPGDEIFFGEEGLLDVDAFVGFVAAEVVTGHWDGYHKANNYRIYHELESDRWSLIPWGTDQTYDRDVPGLSGTSVLITKCFAEPRCLARYAVVAREIADVAESLAVPSTIDHIAELVEDAALADPRKPFVFEKYLRHRAESRELAERWPDELRAAVACVDEEGNERDDDGDGFGACFDDCDDGASAARPGGVEVCDGLDNDCDGRVDELGECGCEAVELGEEAVFLLCVNPLPWSEARAHCEAQGARLAHIDDAAQDAALFAATQQRVRERWYFGFHDRVEEGTWQWLADDEELEYENWAVGDPDDFGEEDCGTLDPYADGAWTDVYCRIALPYVCRLEAAP